MSLRVKNSVAFHCLKEHNEHLQRQILHKHSGRHSNGKLFFREMKHECHHLMVLADFPFVDAKVNVQIQRCGSLLRLY